MPVVVLQPSGRTTLHASQQGPESNLCLSVLALLLNPPLGLIAVCFSVSSRMSANMDWDGARRKGKIAMCFSITGISITLIVGLIVVLVVFTKDSNDT